MLGWIAFFAAAATGACLRHLVGGVVAERTPDTDRPFPWGTFIINASGSLLSGAVTGRSVVLATGFCGAYTTFSTFTFETIQLIEAGDLRRACANVGTTLLTCGVAAAAGIALGSLW